MGIFDFLRRKTAETIHVTNNSLKTDSLDSPKKEQVDARKPPNDFNSSNIDLKRQDEVQAENAESFTFIVEDIQPNRTLSYRWDYLCTGLIRSGQIVSGEDVLIVSATDVTKGSVFEITRGFEKVPSARSGEVVDIFVCGSLPRDGAWFGSENTPLVSMGLLGSVSTKTESAISLEIAELRKSIPGLLSVIENKRAEVTEMTEPYLNVLLEKYEQLTYIDEYDCFEVGDFEKEVIRFINKKLPNVDESFAKPIIMALVTETYNARDKVRSSFNKDMSPFEYETFCAQQLSIAGWETNVTKRSGDQGCDIIAEKEGRRIVIQCKLYNQPVGNKAVQEVFAAQEFHRANAAYVVSNSTFTKSAYQLASSLGVELIHHERLNDIQ